MEKIAACLLFDVIYGTEIVLPAALVLQALNVGHVNCNYCCLGCDTGKIIFTLREYKKNFPAISGNGDAFASTRLGEQRNFCEGAGGACSACAALACDYVQFVSLAGKFPFVGFQILPDNAVKVWRLGNHVRHQKGYAVVFLGICAVGTWAYVAAVKAVFFKLII